MKARQFEAFNDTRHLNHDNLQQYLTYRKDYKTIILQNKNAPLAPYEGSKD